MKVTFLNNKQNKKLIIFFNGWGMDDRAVSHIPHNDFDIIMVSEYYDLSFECPSIPNYEEVYIVAWSLGVWVANNWIRTSAIRPNKCIAINGTLKPIDALNGIAPEAFQGTIDHWDETNRTKFQIRMFKDRKLFSENVNKLPIISIKEQKQVLEILQSNITQSTVLDAAWDKVLIGSDDLIFLTDNQKRFWGKNDNVVELSMPHYPFLLLRTWEQIIG